MNKEINALKSELALVKLQFSERVREVEERLTALTSSDEINAQHQVNCDVDSGSEYIALHDLDLANVSDKPAPIEKPQHANLTAEPSITTPQQLSLTAGKKTTQQVKSSFIFKLIQTIFSSLFDWFSPVTKIYKSYKERGMLGIFTLTIIGIALTLAGFGYLMQLLIDQMAAGAKSLLMTVAAMLVIGGGITLKIKTRFSEFATAIVTLGILLAYSTVYFSGSVYGLIPNSAVLFGYLFIALLCHVLALKLDTKVVAALGIVGIATMPILSNTVSIDALSYLLSLAFVSISSLVLAYRHLGQWLASICLVFVIIAIEWVININGVAISAWIVDLFYLLFFVYLIFTLFNERADNKNTLLLLSAVIGSTVLLFFQASDLFSGQMSTSFVFNAVLAGVASVLFYKVKHKLTFVVVLLTAIWIILAIVSAISSAYWGIAWAVEGLLLLYIGRIYLIPSVIHQGQILTAIAVLYSWSALMLYFPLPALKSVDGWLLSLVVVGVIALWQRLITATQAFDKLTINKIKPLLQLIECLWLSVLLIASATIWLGSWTGAVIILWQFALLFRARYCQQVSIEILAALLISVPLFYVYLGAESVGSFRFMMLPSYAKIAIASAFIQLWLWSQFYRRYQPDSSIKYIAEYVRIAFYMLLPIFWLSSVIRRFDENALMILWLSPAIALFLAQKIQHPLLRKEAKVLTVLASLCFIVVISQLSLAIAISAIAGFLALYLVAYIQDKRIGTNSIYTFVCSWGLIATGFALPIYIGVEANSIFIIVGLMTLYWAILFNTIELSRHFKNNEFFITITNLSLLVVGWLMTFESANYAVMPCLFLLAAIYQKDKRFKQGILAKKIGAYSDLLLHSFGAITYTLLLMSLTSYRLDLLIAPALAVHGALILFLKDKRLTTVKYSFVLILLGIIKLALIDAANALLWQKVVLFMGIGVFILAASFWYQKMVNTNEVLQQ